MANQIDTLYNQSVTTTAMLLYGVWIQPGTNLENHLDTTKFYTEAGPWILKSFPDGKFMLAGLSFLPTIFISGRLCLVRRTSSYGPTIITTDLMATITLPM
ncbi:MAG: hypothetical protein IPN26_15930 [Bacteroidetes bacterium]|nr:hypothetical protein [Bacteroidota bacterium]